VSFLAGGVAFNLLLAGVPFLLMLAAGLGFVLGQSPEGAAALVEGVLLRVFPAQAGVSGRMLEPVFADVTRTRVVFGISGAVGFLWFSVRLFGSLRAVMATVFAYGRDRSVLPGMAWDLVMSLVSMALLLTWMALTSFLAVSSGRVGLALRDLGVWANVLSGVELMLGRLLALVVVALLFGALYRWLPKRQTPWMPTVAGATAAALFFELARWLFGLVVANFPPASIYSGTIGALVVVVFWTYYVALVFVLGAEVACAVHEELGTEPTTLE
jgi:membrane protein